MKNLNICMISSEFPPHCAGIGISVYGLSKALVKHGHKVTVLTRGGYFQETKRSMDGIDVIELPFIALPPPLHLIYHGFFLNNKLRQLESHFDVIHLHTPLVPKVNSSLPKIVSVHSLWSEEVSQFQDSNDLYSLAVKIFKKSVINSEKITLSQADQIVAYVNHKSKLVDIYNSDSGIIHTTKGMICQNFKSQNKTEKIYDVIFVGRLNPLKGVKEFINAAETVIQYIPNARFLIIGEGISKKWMIDEVSKRNMNNNFTFLGFVPNHKLAEFTSSCKVSVTPSRYESFGLVTGEAMLCGLPVIGTNTEGSKRLIKNGLTGYLVKIGDFHSMARKIVELLKHPAKASQMGRNGKIRVDRYFNEEVVIKIYEHAYQEVI